MSKKSVAKYGLRPEYETLSICTTCLDLFDDDSLGQHDHERQRCLCHRGDEPRWPHYDYNERGRLCDCCCRELLGSGTRWSVWFCAECKARVISLNREFGFALIPIGRHSVMNGFALRGGTPKATIERFVQRTGDMFSRMDVLTSWKTARLRGELERLGLLGGEGTPPEAILLQTYVAAIAKEDRRSGIDHRLRAFRALADRFDVWEIVDPEALERAK